jgi:isocitrate lyase
MCRNFSAVREHCPPEKTALNLAKSYDLLAKMADESLQEYRAEKAEPLTNLNFALVIGDEDLPVSGRD